MTSAISLKISVLPDKAVSLGRSLGSLESRKPHRNLQAVLNKHLPERVQCQVLQAAQGVHPAVRGRLGPGQRCEHQSGAERIKGTLLIPNPITATDLPLPLFRIRSSITNHLLLHYSAVPEV